MNELKPCPFCGGQPKFHRCAEIENEKLAAVYKGKIGLHCECGIVTKPFESIEALTDLWNNRADEEENRKCDFLDSGFLDTLFCSFCGEAVGTKGETQRMRFCPYCGKRRTRNEN